MPNLTSVDLVGGVPSNGTGTVSTLDALMADGGQATLGAKANAKSAATDTTAITAMSVWKQISYSIQRLVTAPGPHAFTAAFTTLTRPANTTAYAAADSISNNATAGSVTALSATLSDTNDDPIRIVDIVIKSTDTGLAGKRIRAYLFNSDPTASSGVGAGDNAAFSQKIAGYVGSFSGVMETGFSDGTVGRLVPSFNDGATAPAQNASAGQSVLTLPTSGAKTLYIQFQTLDIFTPSGSSTTIIATARGLQGRAS